jgi:hypothetical protein
MSNVQLIILIDLLVIDAKRNWNALTESLEHDSNFMDIKWTRLYLNFLLELSCHEWFAFKAFQKAPIIYVENFHPPARLSVDEGEAKINYVLIENFTHKISFDLLRIDMENWKARREDFFFDFFFLRLFITR